MADTALYDTLLATLRGELRTLPDKPDESAEATLQALWHRASGRALSVQAAQETPLPALDAAGEAALQSLLARRLAGVPLAHLTERERFMGLEMLAGPGALIPRRETELLARTAISLVAEGAPALVLDVCTGSANVAAAIAAARPLARVQAADLSAEAIALAARNLELLGLAGRVSLHQGDLLGAFDAVALAGTVDVLSCNPPYISAARRATMDAEIAAHEPSLAFDGGPLGVRILQRLIKEAPAWLRPGGWLVFEIGAGQGKAVSDRLRADGRYEAIEPVADEAGETRVLKARRGSHTP
jgi:release factor glutamine methyltransferase